MAYVAISKTLVDTISRNLDNLRDTEMKSLVDTTTITTKLAEAPEIRERLYTTLLGEAVDLRGRLAPYDRECVVSAKIDLSTLYAERGVLSESMLTLVVKMKVPCTAQLSKDYYSADLRTTVALVVTHPLLEEYADAVAAQKEASQRWKAVKEQVMAFISSCKSANEALKLWPDVARYLPASAIATVNRKSEKQHREESAALQALKSVDVDLINTSHVLARMAQGNP